MNLFSKTKTTSPAAATDNGLAMTIKQEGTVNHKFEQPKVTLIGTGIQLGVLFLGGFAIKSGLNAADYVSDFVSGGLTSAGKKLEDRKIQKELDKVNSGK